MFPASDMFLKAEMDYRREQLLRVRPPKRARSSRRQRSGGARTPRRDRHDLVA